MTGDQHWLSSGVSTDNPLLIGMLHIPALPGSPRFSGDMKSVLDHVLADAEAWASSRVSHLMLENFGDVPFHAARVSPLTIAHMTAIAHSVRQRFSVSIGINVLRNDSIAALSIAHAVGGAAIRVNVLSGSRLTDQGIVTGQAADLMRLRRSLDAEHIAVFADVDVKHSVPLAAQSLTDQTRDAIDRALADAVIVSGCATGQGVDLDSLAEISAAAGSTPVLIGSGVSIETAPSLRRFAQGYIIGTSVKQAGNVRAPVDPARVKALVQVLTQ